VSIRRSILEIGIAAQMLSRNPVGITLTLPDSEYMVLLQELGVASNTLNYFRPIDVGCVRVTRDGMPPEDADLKEFGINI